MRGEKEEDRVRRALPADGTPGVSCKESWGAEGASTWLSSVLSLSAAQRGQDTFVLYNRAVPFLAPQNNPHSRDYPTDLTCPEAPAWNLPTKALLISGAI